MSEHKSWADNDVYDLVDMNKYPPNNFVTGRWVLTVKRETNMEILVRTFSEESVIYNI